MRNPDLIFVYGTLRRNIASGAHHSLLRNAIYLGRAHLQAKLFGVNVYPAITLTTENFTVIGEVYELLDQQQLLLLDEYEECPQPWHAQQEYRREIVSVVMQEDNSIVNNVWAYIYNRSTHNLQQILTGDFSQST